MKSVETIGLAGLCMIAVFLVTTGFSGQNSNREITTGTLIREMTDLKNLAEYPAPYYNTVQFSSYDRRSTVPDAPGWFANADGGGGPIPGFVKVLKKPGKDKIGEYLICDVKGPGAIVRLWTAAISGKIRMYLDGKSEPVYNGSAYDFFTKTYNALVPGAPDIFNGSFTQNMAGYYPVPFAKECKIIWVGDISDVYYYHVDIRLYEKGTKVVTFKPSDINTYSAEIHRAIRILTNPDSGAVSANGDTVSFAANIKSGEEKEVLHISGSKGIKYFELKVLDHDLATALRQMVLRISFDGASVPQVQSPVGDFFGTAPGINPYQSLPFTVTSDGRLICRFFMPFKESASITIENMGDKDVALIGKVVTEKYRWDEKRSMYFRAHWKIDRDMLASPDHPSDVTFLQTSGKGVCVGTAIHLLNPTNVPSVYGNWWGEGDEKIFVDDNSSPAFIGTGSEDYFDYAWSSPDIFDYAYCGQPRDDGPGTRGFVTNYRWQILDNIPFKTQFAFYMGLLPHEPVSGFSYARTIYHYGFRGMHDDYHQISQGDVCPLQLPAIWHPIARLGSANSVFYEAEDIAAKNENTKIVSGRLWSGGQLLVWDPKHSGDKLDLTLPITKDGTYKIYITARLTHGSGSFKATINGSDFTNDGGKVDLNCTHGILSRTFSSRPFKLKEGGQKLTLESLQPDKPVGIDFIWIQKVGR